MAADPRDLTTLANLKAWLGVSATVVADDRQLQRMITALSTYLQTWLNRTIASANYTDTYDGTGTSRLTFANYPVTAVSSVLMDGLAVAPWPGYNGNYPAGTWYGYYTFNATTLMLMNGQKFTNQLQNVTVSYTAGFAATPPELEQAVLEVIGLRWRERDRIGVVSQGLAGETITFTQKDFPADVKTILNNYKKVIPS